MKHLKFFFAAALLGSGLIDAQERGSEVFWAELEKHCGKSYSGTMVAGARPGDVFEGKALVMQVLECQKDEIRIPFYVGEDQSRTWVITRDENGILKLKHDHRQQDGSEEKITQYGGQSTNYGFKTQQIFPADLETGERIAYASGNVWWIDLNETSFSYSLRRLGQDRLIRVRFDLTKPIEEKRRPWGWKP